MNKTFYNQRFDGVQALRGLAAVSVLFHHISCIENGAFGVDIFFCISGFIMMYVSQFNTDHFLWKRIIRIVPMYYFITLIAIIGYNINKDIFDRTVIDGKYILQSLFFVPFTGSGKIMPIVKVGWTLNYEMMFYVIIWLSMKISHKYRSLIASVVLVAIVLICKSFGFTNTVLIEFIYGMAAYHILSGINYEKIRDKAYVRWILLFVALMTYVFLWCVKYMDYPGSLKRFIIKGIPAFIIFMCVFIATYGVKVPKPFVFLGDISYSLYLAHYYVARVFNKYFDFIPGAIHIVCVLGISLILAAISYNVFEKKLNSYLRRKLFVKG